MCLSKPLMAGSIPACAGEPRPDGVGCHNFKVYPRVCGGTILTSLLVLSMLGLSPRVRGNPSPICPTSCRTRSIPACAGEPIARSRIRRVLAVYPRVCGGTAPPIFFSFPFDGLSPRVRGNHIIRPNVSDIVRSIPACAGEPKRPSAAHNLKKVYPRVCGGTEIGLPSRCHPNGLSPRVRGNRRACRCDRASQGSIPACAGEPKRSAARSAPRPACSAAPPQVYPRVCGGTFLTKLSAAGMLGLSPRVRGNQYQRRARDEAGRSIPACAGEPWVCQLCGEIFTVYPRVCGGT